MCDKNENAHSHGELPDAITALAQANHMRMDIPISI